MLIREAEIEWHSADPCDVQEHLQGRYDFSLRSVAVSTSLVFQKDVDRQSVAPVCLELRSGFSSQCHFGPVET